jgi:hypothetical protein
MLEVAGAYALKLTPYYATDHGFASIYNDNIFVNEAIFDELGKLGLYGSIWSILKEADDGELAKLQTDKYAGLVKALMTTHTISNGPCYDNQAIDIALATCSESFDLYKSKALAIPPGAAAMTEFEFSKSRWSKGASRAGEG